MPYMLVGGLMLLAALVLFAGFHFSGKYSRPKLLRIGAALTAAGLTLLWVLPWWVISADRGEWAMPMFIGIMFVAVSVLGLGIQLMARACGALEETAFDKSLDDFVRHNDLP